MSAASAPIEEDKSHFYGVYLLCSRSENPWYRNRNYIGFTVNPNRRIIQHNRGNLHGGAKRTNNRGPWVMTMIIHGFPNNISALRFEWAWQQPKESRRLKHIAELKRRKPGESFFDYNFRILTEMLRCGPWNRLPLTIRWLDPEFERDFPPAKPPPAHMTIRRGHIILRSKPKQPDSQALRSCTPTTEFCDICFSILSEDETTKTACLNSGCRLMCHLTCLANEFLECGQYVPISGRCPLCRQTITWGDLVRKRNGCSDTIILIDDK